MAKREDEKGQPVRVYRNKGEEPEPHEPLDMRSIRDLNGKAVISKSDGKKIGEIQDILLDPDSLQIAAVAIGTGSLLDTNRDIIASSEVEFWGQDVIMVSRTDALKPAEEFSEREKWLSLINKVKGKTIVSTAGEKIGQIDDILVDDNGKIEAYRISEGMFGKTRTIPAQTTKTFGEDVVIVDLSK